MKLALQILLGVFILIQIIRPDRENFPIDEKKALHPPKQVEEIMQRACNDCHTNHTNFPWYSNIAPLSWTIDYHVDVGRERFNISNWSDIPKKEKKRLINRAIQTVRNNVMPLPSYKWLHKDARLTQKEKQILINYFESLQDSLED